MSTTESLSVNGERLWESLMKMAEIGALPDGGCNRPAASDLDAKARSLLEEWGEPLGLEVERDVVGNLFLRRPGTEPSLPVVLTGSHLDTQPTGGKFDGVYGVLAGLEVLRTLNQAGIKTRHSIELAVWMNEEGSRFVPACLGSQVLSSDLSLHAALDARDSSGRRLGDELARTKQAGTRPARPSPIKAAFEAHIEQGPILEQLGLPIGIVNGVIGLRWYDVELTGQEAHAGPTPMESRTDPWRAALPIIDVVYQIVAEHAPWGRCTIGDLKVLPASRNTVPGKLIISVDLRHPDPAVLTAMDKQFRSEVARIGQETKIPNQVIDIWEMPPTQFDRSCVEAVRAAVKQVGLPAHEMFSGAGHDSVYTARFAPTSMIFVPCVGGISHNQAEDVKPSDLEAGANVLLHAILSQAEPV